MNLHRFKEEGVDQFTRYLAALREVPTTPPPPELANDPRFTEPVDPIVEMRQQDFATKFEFGTFLTQTLSRIPKSTLRADVGLWCWLAYWYFDQLCPADGNGRRKPKENSKYIARPGDHRYGLDKHLIFFPWKMCSLHSETVKCFLGDSPGADSRAQREWTSYRFNVSNALVALGARLYSSDDGTSMKRNTMGKRPGNLRRFVQVLKQLELTYGIYGMSTEQLQSLLPRHEFSRWLSA